MGKQSKLKMDLPADLAAFLKAGRQLEYDPAACEAGEITLLSLSELKLERFPVETSGLDNFEDDPHYPAVNSYLVPGVNLVAECDEYEPVGLFLWLPVEKRYGIWDSDHCGIRIFGPETTWTAIAADPIPHIEAGWAEMNPNSPPVEVLVPWLNHPYGDGQFHSPQPA